MPVQLVSSLEVARMLGVEADATVVAEVLAATDGWLPAVELAVQRLAEEPAWQVVPRAVLGRVVRQAIEAEPVVATLARLPLFDEEVLRILGGSCTTVPLQRRGRWWSLTPAVRTVARTAGGSGPVDSESLMAVARYLHGQGEVALALQLVRDEADILSVRQLLRELHWSELAGLPLGQLESLVEEIGLSSPTLLLCGARAVELIDRPLRARWLEHAAQLADRDVVRRSIEAERARDLLRAGGVDAGAARALAVLNDTGPGEHVTRGRALSTIGMHQAFQCTPASLAAAEHSFSAAAEEFRRGGEQAWRADALARLGYTALFYAGHPSRGAEAISEALSLLPVGDRTRAYWLTNHADVLAFLGRDLEAEAAMGEALQIGQRCHDDTCCGMAWWMRSWLAAQRGDLTATRAAMAEVEHHRGPWLANGQDLEYRASCAEHLALLGDHLGFAEQQASAQTLSERLGVAAPAQLSQATYDCLHGDAAAGLTALADLEGTPAVIAVHAPRRLLLMAVAHRRLGDDHAARTTAARAYKQAARMGVPDLHERLHRTVVAALGDLVPARTTEAAPTAVLRLLGGWSLTVGDTDRTPAPGHPATLIKLLALRSALSVDEAVEELWPQVDPAVGRARLRNLLNRLKERCGPLVVRAGNQLTLDASVSIDAVAFERAADDALASPPTHRVGLARRALALYGGDLLPGDLYDNRVATGRARLQRRLVSLADLAAADAERRGDLDEAAHFLDVGIAVEPLDEQRAVDLARLLSRQGRPTLATSVARRCADLLADLGLEPGPDLVPFLT